MDASEPIKVKILFFGATADATRARSIVLEFTAGAAASDAFRTVIGLYPELASHRLLYSVNQTYAQGNETLHEGDELAVFTAVSGG